MTMSSKLREALSEIIDLIDKWRNDGVMEHWQYSQLFDIADNALAEPLRNCDRPECATTKAAQDVWRKEDGGKTAYYEWLLATSTKGGNKCTLPN